MPIYAYQCNQCGNEFEKFSSLGAKPPACPKCNSDDVSKLLSGFVSKSGSTSTGGGGGSSCGSSGGRFT